VITTIGNVLLWFGAVAALGSAATFARVGWHTSPWGRLIMSHIGSIAVVLCLGCVRLVAGDATWFAVLRTVAFGVVVVVLYVWWIFLIQAQREGDTKA
jgi:glucose-6-phosphate-specific signal transduction histidine kinase